MNRLRFLFTVFLFSLLVGGVIAVLSFVAAWRNVRSQPQLSAETGSTRYLMRDLDRLIHDFKRRTGVWPRNWNALKIEIEDSYLTETKNGVPLDGWKRPFEYSISGRSYVVTSLGRDGKFGGVGLDCDLTNWQPKPRQAALTLAQFYGDASSKSLRGAAVFLMLITPFAFLFSFGTPNSADEERVRIPYWEMAVSGFFLLVFSVGFAVVMSVFETIPSGH